MTLPDEAVLLSFGELDDAAPERTLGRVTVAVVSESGRYLAAGDRLGPPYVRVVDRTDGSVAAFVERGRGPGEALRVDALSFLGDSLLLVLGQGSRLERFTPAGDWRGGSLLQEVGVTVASVTTGCGGRIFAYGLPLEVRRHRSGPVPWVHELIAAPEPSAQPRLTIPGTAGMSWGALYGFSGTDDGVLVWHKPSDVGYWVPCDGGEPAIWSHSDTQAAVERATLIGGRPALVTTLPDTLFAGAAARGRDRVVAHRWRSGDAEVTRLRRSTAAGACAALELHGAWHLLAGHRDGVVLSTSLPHPRVVLVDAGWLEERLTPVRCP